MSTCDFCRKNTYILTERRNFKTFWKECNWFEQLLITGYSYLLQLLVTCLMLNMELNMILIMPMDLHALNIPEFTAGSR